MQTKRNQYLREMGIDVWVLRRAKRPQQAPAAAPAPAETTVTEVSAAPADTHGATGRGTNPTASPTRQPPRFHLCFATYGDLSLIFSAPESSPTLPADLRHLADDIAMALGRKQEPAINALRWPLVKTAGIDQSEEAAKTVLAERMSRLADRRIVFGDVARQWAGRGDETTVAEIERYLVEPLRKRELWQTLRGMAQ